MGFTLRKAKQKSKLTHKHMNMGLKSAEHYLSINWMKEIFSDESRICIGQGNDAETFMQVPFK